MIPAGPGAPLKASKKARRLLLPTGLLHSSPGGNHFLAESFLVLFLPQ